MSFGRHSPQTFQASNWHVDAEEAAGAGQGPPTGGQLEVQPQDPKQNLPPSLFIVLDVFLLWRRVTLISFQYEMYDAPRVSLLKI